MRPPFCRVGSKKPISQKIINMIPTHEIYVEPFVGSGAIYWDKEPYMHEECYYDYWYGYVKLPADVSVIELASNKWPDGARPVQWTGPHIPGKQVNLEIDIKYQGCSEVDQQFWLIMTHKSHFSNSQTPD